MRFGLDTIHLYLNNNKIGFWNNTIKSSEKISLTFQNANDTLHFSGWSDSGALDGTVITIKDQDSLVLQLTRVSKFGILNHTSVHTPTKGNEKKTVYLDHTIDFYASGADFKSLARNKTYHVFIQKFIDKSMRETLIFDLELK